MKRKLPVILAVTARTKRQKSLSKRRARDPLRVHLVFDGRSACGLPRRLWLHVGAMNPKDLHDHLCGRCLAVLAGHHQLT